MGKAKPASRQALNRATRQGLAALIPKLQTGAPIDRADIIKAIPKNDKSKYSTTYYLKSFRDNLEGIVKTFQAGMIGAKIERKLNAAFKIVETRAKNAPPPPPPAPGPGEQDWELFLVVQRWEWQKGIEAAQEIFNDEANVIVDISGDVETLAAEEVKKNITLINAAERKARGKNVGDSDTSGEDDDTPQDVEVYINRITKQIKIVFK